MTDDIPLISSLQNDQVKALVKLRKRSERDRRGVTIIEEPLVIERAFDAGYPFTTVYFCNDDLTAEADQLLVRMQAAAAHEPERAGLSFVQTSPAVMAKISYRDKPEGLLVTAPQSPLTLDELELDPAPAGGPAPLLVVLEAVEKPGNLGAVLRVADGAGAHGVIVCGGGTDLYNPNVLRASRGAFFSVPTIAAETADVLDFLRDRGVTTVATSPVADQPWNEVDLTGPVAIVLGTEHDGLSAELLTGTDLAVGLPMLGVGDSLNVSTSAAIVLYEAVRQRTTTTGR